MSATWKECFLEVMKKQAQSMHQFTHWFLFIVSGVAITFTIVGQAAAASYELIVQNPEIATNSWITNSIFF